MVKGINILDIIISAIICTTIAFGLWKGMVKQVFSLGGVIVGFLIARNYYEQLSYLVPVTDPGIKKAISFAVIFILSILIASVAGWFTERMIKSTDLNWVNRVGGGAVGFLKGTLIVLIIVVVLLAFLPADSKLLTESRILPYAVKASNMLSSAIPQDIRDKYYRKIEEIASHLLNKEVMEKMKKEADGKGHTGR